MKTDIINLSDPELKILFIKAQAGDNEAYSRFLKVVYTMLTPYVNRKIFDPIEAEDVLQEILIAIHLSLSTFLPTRPLAPWIFSLCQYKMIDSIRRLSRKASRETAILDSEPASKEDTEIQTEEINNEIHEYLNQLPDKQRLVVKLLKLEKLSIIKTAKLIGMSESAVKVCAHRAYKKLRTIREKAYENRKSN